MTDTIVNEEELLVEASCWDDFSVDYDEIDSLEFREQDDPGTRVYGFASARLLMGSFKNNEFSYYTRYSYTGKDACIVLTVGGKTLVLGCSSDEATKDLYEELKERILIR